MNKKLVGLCTSKLQDDFSSEFVELLYGALDKDKFKLMVFNSVRGFGEDGLSRIGAEAIFRTINYDALEILIIIGREFPDDTVYSEIVSKAKQHNLPVIMVGREYPGCFSIISDSNNAFEKVVRHVIVGHKVKDIIFIGGRREQYESDVRLNIFQRILEESKIKFDEKNVFYGQFESAPTKGIVETLIARKRIPEAFICANDVMAMAVIETLEKAGIHVPEDVIVTGFDGTEAAEYFYPPLTTCKTNTKSVVNICTELIKFIRENNPEPETIVDEYLPIIAESCGCHRQAGMIDYQKRSSIIYHRYYSMKRHENEVYSWIERAVEASDLIKIKKELMEHLLRGSYLCSKPNFILSAFEKVKIDRDKPFTDTIQIYAALDTDGSEIESGGEFPASQMIPDLDEWMKDETMYILSPIYVEEEPIGYYAVKTTDSYNTAHKVNRLSTVMNMAFNTVYRKIAQHNLIENAEKAKDIHPISHFLNMRGLEKWFNAFRSDPSNTDRAISVSVYNIKKYKYLLENYGNEEVEEIILFIAKAFRASVRPESSVLAQITEDDFVIFNYSHVGAGVEEINEMIPETTNSFYSIIESYNAVSKKEYLIEVNAGCSVSHPGWSGDITNFIKLANGELYLNRLKMEQEAANVNSDSRENNEDDAKAKELSKKFDKLLKDNMFIYFFQPLVDAHTGEIYAYEALMRTAKEINLFPLEILELAEKKDKLYAIEYATFFNVLEQYKNEEESFCGRRVFINTIPGHFLNDEDLKTLRKRYADYFSHCVIELTEGESLNDDEIALMKSLTNDNGCMIAVDDYGTGHSNIVNLLRYEPQVIKVDRFLITDIHKDRNKQMFVRNAIEFAKENGIKVVAEGVETFEELKEVISLGVDLIQGYYTAKPSPDIISSIPEDIKKQIVEAYQESLE